MSKCKPGMDMSGFDSALGNLVSAQIGLGKELLKALTAGSGMLMDSAKNMSLPKGSSCCDIPEPCWMPKSLGEVCCTLKRGDAGEVCLTITNEDFRAHPYTIEAAGEDGKLAVISKNDFKLGSKERTTVSIKVKVPEKDDNHDNDDGREKSCCECDDLDILIRVRGCNNFYLRWTICIAEKSKECCHSVCVNDMPDYELHWYDHFHIFRPCPNSSGRDLAAGAVQ
jgi:hypothetical protein